MMLRVDPPEWITWQGSHLVFCKGFFPKRIEILFYFRLSEYLLIKIGKIVANLVVNRYWHWMVYVNNEDIYICNDHGRHVACYRLKLYTLGNPKGPSPGLETDTNGLPSKVEMPFKEDYASLWIQTNTMRFSDTIWTKTCIRGPENPMIGINTDE